MATSRSRVRSHRNHTATLDCVQFLFTGRDFRFSPYDSFWYGTSHWFRVYGLAGSIRTSLDLDLRTSHWIASNAACLAAVITYTTGV
eukprot:615569-Pleurochrysis_carterae.AAC.1